MKNSQLNQIQAQLDRLEGMMRQQFLLQKPVLNLEEAAAYLQISVSYLYKLTSRKLIPYSKAMGKTISFKREELDEWRLQNPVMTEKQANSDANSKLMKLESHRKKKAAGGPDKPEPGNNDTKD